MKRYGLDLLLFFVIGLVMAARGQSHQPADVDRVIQHAGHNKKELLKAINRYQRNQEDSLKLKALYFLIANMDLYYSSSYYWADGKGKRIPFDEEAYPTFDSSIRAFNALKQRYGALHPVPAEYRDADTILADYLIENVEEAFAAWKRSVIGQVSFADFCEYILPYRISVEPLEIWRKVYASRFSWIYDSAKGRSFPALITCLETDFNRWFTNTYEIERRQEPLPRLGSLQLLHRKRGPCEDIADLEVFTLRSQGIPATIDEIPVWATSSGAHFLNVAFDRQMNPQSFDVSTPAVTVNKLNREPAKVIRTVYSKQTDVLANKESTENIPEGFMRRANYIDVTREYWATRDVTAALTAVPTGTKIAYACVFNYLSWRPAWWGSVHDQQVTFKDMCKGAVFLPMYYIHGQLKPAGYPVASGYNNVLVLKPDLTKRRTVRLREQAGYLVFRTGKKYKLFYWDAQWKPIGEMVANEAMKELVYNAVPANALLLLVPEYSQHKERPFMITDSGERVWW